MTENRIIQIKKELLTKEFEQNELVVKLKKQQDMKVYSFITVAILFYIVAIFWIIKGENNQEMAFITLLFFIPLPIILSLFSYFKAKKLIKSVKDGFDYILALKHELIELEYSK